MGAIKINQTNIIKNTNRNLFNASFTETHMSEKKTEWVKVKPDEAEKMIVDLHKEGNSPAKIGLILRDKHGIPKVKMFGKKITKVLKDAKVEYETEKKTFQRNLENLEKHITAHKHDYTAKRSLTKKVWTVKKLK